MTLLLALIACAPSPEPMNQSAAAKAAGDVELTVDVECADPDCTQLVFDASASTTDGNGISAYRFDFEDGSSTEDAWAFHTPFAGGGEHEVVSLALEVEGAGEYSVDIPVVTVDGFNPDGGMVYFRPSVVKDRDGNVKYCDLQLEIVGCLRDVSEVRTRLLPSGSVRTTSVSSADQKVTRTPQRLRDGETLSYRVIKVDDEGNEEAETVTISCEPRSIVKGGGA